jgi:hypothetical protein
MLKGVIYVQEHFGACTIYPRFKYLLRLTPASCKPGSSGKSHILGKQPA